jgi:hypothetical protein
MKKFTLILISMLFLLVGGVSSQTQTSLVLKGGSNWEGTSGGNLGNNRDCTSDVIQFKDKRAQYSYMTNNDWVDATEGTHTFVVTLGSSYNEDCTLHIAALNEVVSGSSFDNGNIKSGKIIKEESISVTNNATLTLSVSSGYAAIILWQTSNSDWRKVNIASFTREIGSGGGGSASNGKTSVSYNIPGKNVIFSDSFDSNINNWQRLNQDNGSVDWDGTIGHDANGCMKVVNNSSRNDEQWKIQRKVSFNPNISSGTTFFVTFYIKCESGTGSIRCSTTGNAQYQGDQNVSTEWQQIVWEVTAGGNIDGLCLDMAQTANTYYIDDVEIYTNAVSGGSNVFTSDDQVANISSSAFSSLEVGDYICADVTGTPETIKLTCNGNDYPLTQFNGSTLWGIKATAAMVDALKANDSQFKGRDLTLNGISIYKTKTISESSSDNGITLVNNTFVEQNRPFAANKWNTVCLPYKPTAAQATLLFGTGYQISEFTGVSGTTLQFTSLNSIDDFVAGRPYLLMPGTGFATAETSPVVLEDVNITADTPETVIYKVDEKNYSFSGTFNTKSFAETEWSTIRFVSNNLLMTPNSTDAMKGLRCYFTLPAADGARSFSLGFDEEGNTTGVADINRETIANNGAFFNLAGQRVAQPTKGLYIVNGKKVVIK